MSYMAKRNVYNSDFQSNISENLPTLDNALLEIAKKVISIL